MSLFKVIVHENEKVMMARPLNYVSAIKGFFKKGEKKKTELKASKI